MIPMGGRGIPSPRSVESHPPPSAIGGLLDPMGRKAPIGGQVKPIRVPPDWFHPSLHRSLRPSGWPLAALGVAGPPTQGNSAGGPLAAL